MSVTEHPLNDTKPCGYKERIGEKKFREKKQSLAQKLSRNLQYDLTQKVLNKPSPKIIQLLEEYILC